MPADRSYEAGPSRPRSRPSMDGANGKKKSYKTAKPRAPTNASSFPEKHKPQALEYRTPDGLPGVNKIKASIRQTTRLLKKVGRAIPQCRLGAIGIVGILEQLQRLSKGGADRVARSRAWVEGPNGATTGESPSRSCTGREERYGKEARSKVSHGQVLW